MENERCVDYAVAVISASGDRVEKEKELNELLIVCAQNDILVERLVWRRGVGANLEEIQDCVDQILQAKEENPHITRVVLGTPSALGRLGFTGQYQLLIQLLEAGLEITSVDALRHGGAPYPLRLFFDPEAFTEEDEDFDGECVAA